MGRRKKELASFHRDYIIQVAERLFEEKGIEKTTMDHIAKAAEYSKATLYVYFKNKEEIIGCLTLKSMELLNKKLSYVLNKQIAFEEKYEQMCMTFAEYHDKYPVYFQIFTGEINVDIENEATPPIYKEIFDIGESNNRITADFLKQGIEEEALREDIDLPQTALFLWSSLVGIIQITSAKEVYIKKAMGLSREDMLKSSYQLLLNTIRK